MSTNEKQYYIYVRSLKERIPVTKEEFDNYYRGINAYRQKEQYHKRCVCPKAKFHGTIPGSLHPEVRSPYQTV